jgi:hypothetical protein
VSKQNLFWHSTMSEAEVMQSYRLFSFHHCHNELPIAKLVHHNLASLDATYLMLNFHTLVFRDFVVSLSLPVLTTNPELAIFERVTPRM